MSIKQPHIRLEYLNGSVWGIPLRVIAHERATHYAAHDEDTTYQEEFDYVMSDENEGQDWFFNQMDWADVRSDAFEIKLPDPFDPSDFDNLSSVEVKK